MSDNTESTNRRERWGPDYPSPSLRSSRFWPLWSSRPRLRSAARQGKPRTSDRAPWRGLAVVVAAALLAVLFVPGGQFAPAHAQKGPASTDATLSGLEVANATTGSDAPLRFITYAGFAYSTVTMLKEVTDITVKPTATAGDDATITVQLESGGTPQTVASGTASSSIRLTPKADSRVPHNILVKVTAEDGVTSKTHTIGVWQYSPVSFGGATVPDVEFTAGSRAALDRPQGEEVRLPEGGNEYVVTYTATGLPAGLSLGSDRVIYGTPEAATNGPVTVTYTAEGEIGSSDSLTFQVTVNPAVTFDAAALKFCNSAKAVYSASSGGWVNAGNDGTITFPAASGGTGTLAYSLIESDSGTPLADVADGITFDTSTRKLGGTPSAEARKQWSVRYRAQDNNGSYARCFTSVHAGGYGGL